MRNFLVVLAACTVALAGCGNDGDKRIEPEPLCGNGALDATEACEGFELRGATCASEGFSGGRLGCSDDCTLDTSLCTTCGDGSIDNAEVCEPGDFSGATCASLLGPGFVGELECAPDCGSVSTHNCRADVPAGAFTACDPTVGMPCSDSTLQCLTTTQGDFCLQACAVGTPGSCGTTDYCYDLDGQGICVDIPGHADVCSVESGCSERTDACTPMFSETGNVSTCMQPCPFAEANAGRGSCPVGEACMVNPGGQLERQSPDVTCTVLTEVTDCQTPTGFRCLEIVVGAGTEMRCARPYTVCATAIPFYNFDGPTEVSASLCDRSLPRLGANLCGIGVSGTAGGDVAQIECYPLFEPDDRSQGVCVGFCDAALGATGGDLFCGDDATCVVPNAPQFFFAEAAVPVTCTLMDLTNCGVGFTSCVDLGDGPECARPAKICEPN